METMLLGQAPVTSEARPAPSGWRPAAQQPQWHHHSDYRRTLETLENAPALVTPGELAMVRRLLADVATGRACLLQAGDCAESFYECTPRHTAAKVDVLDRLGDDLEARIGRPVARIGRMAGQFAKPRSESTERHGEVELPVFRGHLVNSEIPTVPARSHDPRRMLWAYKASAKVQSWLRSERVHRDAGRNAPIHRGPWSSHEALAIDYESSVVRTDSETGTTFLGSTHMPWIGERTRQPDSAHVRLLALMDNPVACKIGPNVSVDDVLQVCELLDPDRIPGRLTLIVRMGRARTADVLPPIVTAVRRSGHPVIWVSDPMHANTVRTSFGAKTRYLGDMTAEIATFREVLEDQHQHPGGLHLEVAASQVTECIGGPVPDEDTLRTHYTTLCDPRLNYEQALEVLRAWA